VQLLRGTVDHELSAHVWAGYSARSTDRPIARLTYQVRRLRIDAGAEATASIVGTGPLGTLLGGHAWYAAGIAPALSQTAFRWRAAHLVDADADARFDEVDGRVTLQPIGDTTARTLDYLVPAMARAGWDRGAHHVELTLIGHAARDASFLANATQRTGIDRNAWVGDGIATWRGTWKQTPARAQLAWHRSVRREDAHDPSGAAVQLLSAYVPADLFEDPGLGAACNDMGDDPYPMITNCTVPTGFFASAGAGRLVDTVGDRPTATVDVAHILGAHTLRVGATFEDSRLVQTSRFSGGALDRSLFVGHVDRQQFLGTGDCGDEPGSPCDYASSSRLAYRTRYAAAYLEDTFEPAPQIRVDGGLRWELMRVGSDLEFSNQLAPRLGIAWDLQHHARAWVSMGRSYLMLPPGLGATVISRDPPVRDGDFGIAHTRTIERSRVARIADDLESAAQDELTAGIEAGYDRYLKGVAWIQRRSQRRGLETVADPTTGVLAFDNPGGGGQIAARRESYVLALGLQVMPSPRWFVRAGAQLGKTVGTWVGPFDPRVGATQLGGSDWDASESSTSNLHGLLPSAPGKRGFVEGERRGTLLGLAVSLATRLTVASGRPRNVLGLTEELGFIHLLPRGSAGRGPMQTQANVRLGASWRGFDLTLDVFNVFDDRTATNLDEVYSDGALRPIVGGAAEDLVFLKHEVVETNGATIEQRPASRRTTYQLPSAFQSPIAAVLGIHRAF
ncbi:MAG: TonB-dependent receptor, partial [Kofleriaceae bacterium]